MQKFKTIEITNDQVNAAASELFGKLPDEVTVAHAIALMRISMIALIRHGVPEADVRKLFNEHVQCAYISSGAIPLDG